MVSPIRLEGVKDLETALRLFDYESSRQLNSAINAAARTVSISAKGYITNSAPAGLSNWAKAINRPPVPGARNFPRFNDALMRQGLRIVKQKNQKDPAGWVTTVAVEQRDPAGNIYEKGGIVPGPSTRKNYSINPNASIAFKTKLQNFYFIGKGEGRALIRAGREDAGMARTKIARARYEAELKLQRLFNLEAVKNG